MRRQVTRLRRKSRLFGVGSRAGCRRKSVQTNRAQRAVGSAFLRQCSGVIGRRAFLGLAATGASCGFRREGPLELRLGHVNNPGSLVDESTIEFARRANEELDGRARVSVFGSSQLGDDKTLLLKLKLGTVDFACNSTIMSSEVDSFGLFEMPYLCSDRAHILRMADEVFWPYVAPSAESRDLKVIGLWENGFRQVTNSVRPIVKPADLAGIKLRTPRGRWRLRLFQSYGANPTPMSLSEVFVALQTGVIDGQENPLTQIWSQKFQEVQRYLSLSNHVYSPAFMTVGLDRWRTLPSDVTETLENIARGMQPWVLERAEEIDRGLLARFEEAMEVNGVDRRAFVDASAQIYEEFSNEIPGAGDWIRRTLALAET